MQGDERGQSESIGAVLLVGIVALSLATYGAFYFGTITDRRGGASADVDAELTETSVTLTHMAGDPIDESEISVRLYVNGTEWTNVTWAAGTIRGTDDGTFEAGERWVWDAGTFSEGDSVRLLLIDGAGGEVRFRGTLRVG